MKKLLALVLALVMVMGLSVVSTNAAFSDEDKIDHEEAVEVMNSLGIIVGKPGGNFDPDGSVTRAEMAKMVSIALLGEIDPAAFAGAASDLTDINGHWAEGYIKFCVSNGIVSGKGNGIFDPNSQVKTVEAAKMLLVALGYNADVREYKGASWTLNVMRDAQQKGLLKSLTNSSTTAAMDRDDAAQMIYNTLNAFRVIEDQQIDKTTGDVTLVYKDATVAAQGTDAKLLGKTFNAKNQIAYLSARSYNEGKNEFTYTFVDGTGMDFNSGAITDKDKLDVATKRLTSNTDYTELWGRKVNVVYDDDNKVIGVYANPDSTVLYSGIMKDIPDDLKNTDTSMKLGGTSYSLINGENATANDYFYDFLNGGLAQAFFGLNYNTLLKPFEIEVIDNTGDGRINLIVVHPFTAARVSYVGSSSFNVSITDMPALAALQPAATDRTNIKFADVDTYEGIAKDDFVMIVDENNAVKGVDTYVKLDTVTGQVSGARKDAVTIDGTSYKLLVDNDMGLSSNYALATVNGYVVGREETAGSADASDYVIVVGADAGNGVTGKQAKLLFSDGTKKTVDTKYDYSATGTAFATATGAGQYGATGSICLNGNVNKYDNFAKYEIVDGDYVLTSVDGLNAKTTHGFDGKLAGAVGTYAYDSGSNSAITAAGKTYRIADDAVVFVADNTYGEIKVVTGAQLKRYATADVARVNTAFYDNNSSTGYDTIEVAYVTLTAGKSIVTTDKYAYITGNVDTVKNSKNEKVTSIASMWTEDGKSLENVLADTTVANIEKGSIVTFVENSDGSYKIEAAKDLSRAAVTSWDGKNIQLTNATLDTDPANGGGSVSFKVDSDTKVVGINTDDKAGVEGAVIAIAEKNEDTTGITTDYLANAYYKASGTDVDIIFIDTFADAPQMKTVATVSADDFDAFVDALGYKTVNVTSALTLTGDVVIPEGTTVNFAGAVDDGGFELKVNGNATFAGAITQTGTISVGAKGTVNFGMASTIDTNSLAGITGVAGATVTFDKDGTAATPLTGVTTFTGFYKATNENAAATLATALSDLEGNTYRYVSDTDTTSAATTPGWLLSTQLDNLSATEKGF